MKENIGRYDIAKGIGIICVVVQHTIGLFDINTVINQAGESFGISTVLGFLLVGIQLLARNVVMPLFFIISGFGFRPALNAKAVKKYARFLVKPYIVVGIITSVLHCMIHYACFRYMKGAVTESLKVLLSFAVVQTQTHNYGDVITLYANGPAWFLIVLFNAWMLLSLICKKLSSDKSRGIIVVILTFIGSALAYVWPAGPFAIPQSLIATGFLFAGHMIKKNNLLDKKLPTVTYVIMTLMSLITVVLGNVDFGYNVWKLGVIDIIGSACYAYFIIKLVGVVNEYNNLFLDLMRKLGGLSLWIICIHSIEMIAIPWYLVRDRFVGNIIVGFLVILVLRTIVLIAGNAVFLKSLKFLRKRRVK